MFVMSKKFQNVTKNYHNFSSENGLQLYKNGVTSVLIYSD